MITQPFDENAYPRLYFSRQQLDVIALAREMGSVPLRTVTVAAHFGWSLNKAYKILRRLRDKGVFHSQLMWVILPNAGHAARVEEDGSRRLFSWLELHLQPMAQWGKVPDQVQTRFAPRVNGQGERANRFPLTPATDRGADTEEVSDDKAN